MTGVSYVFRGLCSVNIYSNRIFVTYDVYMCVNFMCTFHARSPYLVRDIRLYIVSYRCESNRVFARARAFAQTTPV